MELSIFKLINSSRVTESANCVFEPVSECPRCRVSILPVPITGFYYSTPSFDYRTSAHYYANIFFLCPHCKRIFSAEYSLTNIHSGHTGFEAISCTDISPLAHRKVLFPESIQKLSPRFTETYIQSEIANEQKLSEIAGCGYRKSIEFLVKDYLIHIDPDSTDIIKNEFLSTSIKRINNHRVETLAERATWIGNDETHYTRKHEGRDVEDMKVFIRAMLSYIESELAFEDALGISPQK